LRFGKFIIQIPNISEFLVDNGYTCWILEWRNHGESSKVDGPYNFEIIGKEDISAAFEYLFNSEKIENLDCITHSGGGISLTISLRLSSWSMDRESRE